MSRVIDDGANTKVQFVEGVIKAPNTNKHYVFTQVEKGLDPNVRVGQARRSDITNLNVVELPNDEFRVFGLSTYRACGNCPSDHYRTLEAAIIAACKWNPSWKPTMVLMPGCRKPHAAWPISPLNTI